MFETSPGVLGEGDRFDPAWLDEAAWLDDVLRPQEIHQPPVPACAPLVLLAELARRHGRIIWTDPTGHTHTSHPHDYRPDPHPPPDEDPPPF